MRLFTGLKWSGGGEDIFRGLWSKFHHSNNFSGQGCFLKNKYELLKWVKFHFVYFQPNLVYASRLMLSTHLLFQKAHIHALKACSQSQNLKFKLEIYIRIENHRNSKAHRSKHPISVYEKLQAGLSLFFTRFHRILNRSHTVSSLLKQAGI